MTLISFLRSQHGPVFISFILYTIILICSSIQPFDNTVWFLEIFPSIVGAILLIYYYPVFKFSNLVYVLLLFASGLSAVGGHYTYTRVPLFNCINKRNNYDKFGHFFQGFVPVLLVRELLDRQRVVIERSWLSVICILITLALAAIYELLEWFIAVLLLTDTSGKEFLAMQGSNWDAQSDMLMCLIGSIISLMLLTRYHDKQIEKLHAVHRNNLKRNISI
jgi:putative membrane protein